MTDRRATSPGQAIPPQRAGTDLHLELAGGRGRAALVAALREAIRGGRLAPGVRLPSSRTLAPDLGVARNTVAEAYGQLVAEGWLTARQGSGTVVADRPADPVAPRRPVPRQPEIRYDLTPGSPDVSIFPRTAWLAATRKAWSAAPNEAFGYGDIRGRPELRAVLADYLARARGVHADPEHILICSGYVQALGLLTAVLRTQGATTMSVEEYGYDLHRDVIRAHGLTPVPVPVDADGLDPDGLSGAAALLTPAHQMPTGVALAPARRTALVEWARAQDAVLVEDDYDGEFRYDRQPVGALQPLDPERVVYTGTASKSLSPGLRLAWMVVPHRLLEPLVAAKRTADHHTGTLDQLVLAEFIASGQYDRQVRRARLHYRRRRDRLVTLLSGLGPSFGVAGISAGLHLVLDVPDDAETLTHRAARSSLALDTLRSFHATTPAPTRQALVIGYGAPPDHTYPGALEALHQVLTDR